MNLRRVASPTMSSTPSSPKVQRKRKLDPNNPDHQGWDVKRAKLVEYSGFRAATNEVTWKCGWETIRRKDPPGTAPTRKEFKFFLFIGIPKDDPTNMDADDTERYVCLGNRYGTTYLRKEDVYKRLVSTDPDSTYKTDFANADIDPTCIPVW